MDRKDFLKARIMEGMAKKSGTEPKTDKEKSLAALAHPKDKITHKDVLVGRGVLKKEESEYINMGGARVKNDEKSVLKHIQKTFPNVKKVKKDPQHGWSPVFKEATSVTDYNPKSQGGTRKELLAKYAKTKDPKHAESARKAGASQSELKAARMEEVELDENYRVLATKGIGAERKEDIKVGHGVDYYHPKDGSKHMGKIHSMNDKGYVVRDDKTGEKHKFQYYRRMEEEVEQIDEASWTSATSMHGATRKQNRTNPPTHNIRKGDVVKTSDGKKGTVSFVDGDDIHVTGTNIYYPKKTEKHSASTLKKEEVEQVNEISSDTAKSYLDKVRFKQARRAVKANMGAPKENPLDAAALDKTSKSMELARKRVKEEVEQIDELKKSTMASYVKKAAASYGRDKQLIGRESPDGTVKNSRPEMKKAVKNRLAGINRAAERLAKEEVKQPK